MIQKIVNQEKILSLVEGLELLTDIVRNPKAWKTTCEVLSEAESIIAEAKELKAIKNNNEADKEVNEAKAKELEELELSLLETNNTILADIKVKNDLLITREDIVKAGEADNAATKAALDKRDADLAKNEANYLDKSNKLVVAQEEADAAKLAAEIAEAASIKTQQAYNKALDGLKAAKV